MFLVQRYPARELRRFLRRKTVATMPELKEALGTDVGMTVFRKLHELGYLTSYSHGSSYYTLKEIARFDAQGLWSFRDIRFSRFGTLLATLVRFVERSRSGAFARELQERLHVGVKESLLRLVRQGALHRKKVSGLYLYCSKESEKRRRQVASRLALEGVAEPEEPTALPDEVKAAIVLFVSVLDERERRLYAGLESLKQGRGGDRRIAELLGIHPQTVARGRQELLAHDVEVDRIRRSGGGRKRVEKKRQKRSPGSRS